MKRYRSEKIAGEDSEIGDTKRITLESINPNYEPIVLRPRSEGDVVVVAEFVGTL